MQAPSSTVHAAGQTSGQEASEASWPGRDVKVADYLPGSVYLWACGEPGEGGRAPELADAVAAWVVLLTQAALYSGLWVAGGNQYDPDGEDPGGQDPSPKYSILAIAGSMYLLLSIPAADLFGGCALIWEEGSGLIRRRAFGFCLVGTFVLLVGGSIRVLFFSSIEDTELVLGAAAVLFIADVDEKAMMVLKNFSGQWRLFWVIEILGLSFLLTLFSVKVTGNDKALWNSSQVSTEYCGSLFHTFSCGIYTWGFILETMPVVVTLCALLLSRAVSNRDSVVFARILKPLSCGSRLLFLLLLIGWLGLEYLWVTHKQLVEKVEAVQGGLTFLYVAIFCRGEVRQAYRDAQQISETDRRRRWRLFLVATGVILLKFVIEIAHVSSRSYPNGITGVYYDENQALCFVSFFLDIPFHIVYIAIYASFIDGMWALPSPTTPPDRKFADSARSMVLGWGLSNGMWAICNFVFWKPWEGAGEVSFLRFVAFMILLLGKMFHLMWFLAVGTWLRTVVGIGNIAFWSATSMLMWQVFNVFEFWIIAYTSHMI